MKKYSGVNTNCVHSAELDDPVYQGAVNPIYVSTSFGYLDMEVGRYPRYFNTPNQEALSNKIAVLEKTDKGLIFGSGMAAISTALLSVLSKGDHIIMQKEIYGGSFNFVLTQFKEYGIEHDWVNIEDFDKLESYIKPNTKAVYIETPSNPLLAILDISLVTKVCKKNNLVSLIDNTFASPINLNPAEHGVDIVIHSATKYLSGHSDICAGAIATSNEHFEKILMKARNFGGNLSDWTVNLLDRSIKTLGIRIKQHNENGQKLSELLNNSDFISKVYYPGLKDHPNHDVAKKQMNGFGGMMSFELDKNIDSTKYQKKLKLIKSSMSLAAVESTILSPALTSHSLMPIEEREKQGINDQVLRFSVGIEEVEDLWEDLKQAAE